MNAADNSRIGCGSYIGLLTEYAGVADIRSWVFDRCMPKVKLPDVWIPWLGGGIAHELYRWGYSSPLLDVFREIEVQAQLGIIAAQGVAAWNSGGSARSLLFCDPGWMMNWVDQQNAATRWARDRGVTIRYDVPPTSDLQTWRNRP